MMEQFTIAQGGFQKVKKKILVRIIPIMMIALIGGVVISFYGMSDIDVKFLPFIIPILCLPLGFGLYRGLNRQKILFESYQLIADNGMLTRHQFNTPTLTMYYQDIICIEKSTNGGFVVKANNCNSKLIIPAQVENYTELEVVLSSIKPITPKTSSPLLKYASFGMPVIAVVLMACVYISENKILVGTSAALIVALMAYSLYEIQTNKNIDNKTKRTSWFVLLVLIVILIIAYRKLVS